MAGSTPTRTPARAPARGVGTRAGLDLERIVEAARSLQPRGKLSMQAVADVLGVDRSALNHHVSDRETLLSLVAIDVFSEAFAGVRLIAQSDWKEASRVYARGLARGVIATGDLVDHLKVSDVDETPYLAATETTLRKLLDAGFSYELATRLLVSFVHAAFGHARDQIDLRANGETRSVHLRAALATREPYDFPALSHVATLGTDTYGPAQLELSLDLLLSGAEVLLAARR